MSDAVCGPSNPLQQFKQQTQHDRTLQQDRIANRQHPAQGFRSPDPNAGLLDSEFEAFQAGLPAPGFQQFQHYQHAPKAFQQPFQEPAQAPSWASDFQRMSLASPPSMQQQQPFQAAGSSTANWAQGFRDSIAQSAPRAQNSSPSPYAFQQRARFGMNSYQSNFTQPAFAPVMQSKGKEPATEQFDEAAFERAFDMARDDMMVQDAPVQGAQDQATDSTTSDLHEAHGVSKSNVREMQDMLANQQDSLDEAEFAMQEDLISAGLGGDGTVLQESIQETQQEPERSSQEDEDALAATAHELLEKVENNKTDKFRNSQFLGLMRKLRDREIKVEGDKMVEKTTSASTSTADHQLNTTPSTRFNNSEQTPAPVDFRPSDYGIPSAEQDHDPLRDGAAVSTLLNQPGLPGGEPEIPVGASDGPGDDIEHKRLEELWRSMLPESAARGVAGR